MPLGEKARRTVLGFAWMVTVLASSGCQGLPFQRSVVKPYALGLPQVTPPAAAKLVPEEIDLPPLPSSEQPLQLASSDDVNLPTTPFRPVTLEEEPKRDEDLMHAEALVASLDKSDDGEATPSTDERPPIELAPQPTEAVPKPGQAASKQPEAKPSPSPDPLPLTRAEEKTDRKPIDADAPAPVVDPRALWLEALERVRALARERTETEPSVGSDWPLRARLLGWLAETTDDADAAPRWRVVLKALAAIETPEDRARSSEIRAAVEALEGEAPLEITDLSLCRKVSGFGNFEPVDSTSFPSGRAVIVYCEIAGLQYEKAGEQFRSRLSSEVELVNAKSRKTVWSQSLGTAEDLCRRRRRDYYVNYRITLPERLPPGEYEIRLTQTDLLASRATAASIALTIVP